LVTAIVRFKHLLDRIPLVLYLPLLVLMYTLLYYLAGRQDVYPLVVTLDKFLTRELLMYIAVGMGAQLIDGALGMAYGVSASSFLMSVGVSPAAASAAVHVAEVFTTGASGISHLTFRNVNKRLFKAMVIPGVLGAIFGAYILTSIDGDAVKPYVSVYLLIMGAIIIRKAFRKTIVKRKVSKVGVLAAIGGFVDSIGGGGWGPVVTSTLLSRGRDPRYTIGTVNATEFFVAFASAGVFTWLMGLQNLPVIAGLVIGGILASPFGALLAGRIKPRTLMIMVGVMIIFLSLRNIIKYLPF
jgi:uncharacterized protein